MYATEQMESYYSKVTIQVNELQEFHQDVEEGFEEILKTKKAGTVKEKKQSILAYVEHLQERYRSINNIFFIRYSLPLHYHIHEELPATDRSPPGYRQ